jgi:uncharacterized protein
MGHRDSSAQHGGHSGVCAAGRGAAETVAAPLIDQVNQINGIKREKRSAGAWVLLLFVRMYVVFLSPFFGCACKFYPSCSNYAYEAVARHGASKGAGLAIKRLLRCRPFTKGGYDPVPEILYGEDALQEPKSADVSGLEIASRPGAHRPTQPVVAETWSAAGTLGVERRL